MRLRLSRQEIWGTASRATSKKADRRPEGASSCQPTAASITGPPTELLLICRSPAPRTSAPSPPGDRRLGRAGGTPVPFEKPSGGAHRERVRCGGDRPFATLSAAFYRGSSRTYLRPCKVPRGATGRGHRDRKETHTLRPKQT